MQITSEIVLGALFAMYYVAGIRPPHAIATLIDTLAGKLLIFCIILYLFIKRHFILGVLAIVAFYDLMRKSSAITGIGDLMRYAPTEEKKFSELTAYNQFPYTLEQEVVAKMTTAHFNQGSSISRPSWKPNLERAFRDSVAANKI